MEEKRAASGLLGNCPDSVEGDSEFVASAEKCPPP